MKRWMVEYRYGRYRHGSVDVEATDEPGARLAAMAYLTRKFYWRGEPTILSAVERQAR